MLLTVWVSVMLIANGIFVGCYCDQQNHISLTISARLRQLEISWYNVVDYADATILLTDIELAPNELIFVRNQTVLDDNNKYYIDNSNQDLQTSPLFATTNNVPILFALSLNQSTGWQTTSVPFNYELSRNVTTNTTCYGYWATLVGSKGQRIQQTCIRAYPRWMNDYRSQIDGMRIRDLFLVGSHDSGSYRLKFDPQRNETRVSKYTLTQVRYIILYLNIKYPYYNDCFCYLFAG